MEVTVAFIAKIQRFPLIPKVDPYKAQRRLYIKDKVKKIYIDLVKSNPCPPQHEDSNDGIASTPHGRLPPLVPPTNARSQHDGPHQSSCSSHQVDPTAAGHINRSQRLEESFVRPEPASGNTENEGVEHGEHDVEVEVCPLTERAGYDGGAWEVTVRRASLSLSYQWRRRRIGRRMKRTVPPF